MNRHKKFSKTKLIQIIIAGIVLVLIVLALFFIVRGIENEASPLDADNTEGIVTRTADTAKDQDDRVYIDGRWYRYKREIRTTLLIGVDDFGPIRDNDAYRNSNQSDFLLLLAKNDKTGDVFSIQINRDTMTSVPTLSVGGEAAGRNVEQIALAYSYGGGGHASCENVVEAVRYLLYGLPVKNYIAMTMSGIPVLNDEVGGVTLPCICDFPQLGFKKDQIVTLTGDQALTYVRARMEMEDPTNVARMERQKQYILAWSDIAKDKFKSADKATQLIEHISPYLCTNCDSMTLAKMAQELAEYKGAPIYVPEGTVDYESNINGFVENWVDETKLKQLVLDLFYEPIDEIETEETMPQ